MEDGWRGIMCIAATPFDDRGVLLFDELAGFTDWMIRAGSHAVSWPLGYSEFTVLAHEERMRGTPIVVEAASGRVPVLIGVSAQCLPESEAYCRRAQECGADAVVCMLPMGFNANNYAIVRDYYQAVAEAAQLPVFIQNQGPPWAALSAKTIVQLCRDIGLVEYVKEEKPPQTKSCQEILDICGDDMRGVCAGGGGNYLIPEMERGISGNFPGAPVVDVLVRFGTSGTPATRRRPARYRTSTLRSSATGGVCPRGHARRYWCVAARSAPRTCAIGACLRWMRSTMRRSTLA